MCSPTGLSPTRKLRASLAPQPPVHPHVTFEARDTALRQTRPVKPGTWQEGGQGHTFLAPGQVVVVSDSARVHLGVAHLCVCVWVSECVWLEVGAEAGGGTSGIQGTLTLKGLPGTLSSPHLTMRM